MVDKLINYGVNLTNREPFIEILPLEQLMSGKDFDGSLLLKKFDELTFRVGGFFNEIDMGSDTNMFSGFLCNYVTNYPKETFKGDVLLFKLDQNSKVAGFTEEEVSEFVKRIFDYLNNQSDIEVDYSDNVDDGLPVRGTVIEGDGAMLLQAGRFDMSVEKTDMLGVTNTIRRCIGHYSIIPLSNLWQEYGKKIALVVNIEASKNNSQVNPFGTLLATKQNNAYTEVYDNALILGIYKGITSEGVLGDFNEGELKGLRDYLLKLQEELS